MEPADAIVARLGVAGLAYDSIAKLREDLADAGGVRKRIGDVAIGVEGLHEVDTLRALVEPALAGGAIAFEPFLARGLDYYTGPVFEFGAPGLGSSIASGGRYDELVGMFSKEQVPACGGSLGLERIIMLTAEQDRTPLALPQVLVTVWDDAARADALALAAEIRTLGYSVETYPGDGALGKQLKYASQKQVRVAVIVGPDERAKGLVTIKDLAAQIQQQIPRAEAPRAVAQVIPRG
jgi:histidyl-tRNA synthetase